MNFYALKLQKIQEAGLFGGTRVVRGKDPDGRAFGAGFFDSTLALQIKVVEKFLAVGGEVVHADRKSTRLNSSHGYISYAVFCLKKKKSTYRRISSAH